MTQYIQKDALKVEIESKKKCAQYLGDNAINSSMQQFYDGMKQGCADILSTLDTLEVKKVDLDKEIQTLWSLNQKSADSLFIPMNYNGLHGIAKYFFELGFKAQKGEEA